MKTLYLFLFSMLLSSCTFDIYRNEIYGVWVDEQGGTFEFKKDGTFVAENVDINRFLGLEKGKDTLSPRLRNIEGKWYFKTFKEPTYLRLTSDDISLYTKDSLGSYEMSSAMYFINQRSLIPLAEPYWIAHISAYDIDDLANTYDFKKRPKSTESTTPKTKISKK